MKCKIQQLRPIYSKLYTIQILLIAIVINICFHVHFARKLPVRRSSISRTKDLPKFPTDKDNFDEATKERQKHSDTDIEHLADKAVHQERVEKATNSQLKQYYTPDALDMSRIHYLDNIITHLRSDVIKKSMENDHLIDTNKQLEKNYDQFNNQYIIYQSKIDSSISNIGLLDSVKSSYDKEIEKLKEGNSKLHEIRDYFAKINSDIENKSETIQKYQQKVQKDIHKFNEQKTQLQSQFEEKTKNLEITKNAYMNDINSNLQLIESIKKSYSDLAKEEIKLKKTQKRAHELELQMKGEENAEKLLSLEIEHIKSTNLAQVQKIEELKQEIEKSKNLAKYLKEDIHELEDKLSNIENESTQSQLEYELKKNELEDKLNKLKEEMKNEDNLNQEEKEKYVQIEKDLKNRISSLSLQNFNSISDSKGYFNSDILQNTISVAPDNHGKFYKFKQREGNPGRANSEEEALKQQIISILKNLNQ